MLAVNLLDEAADHHLRSIEVCDNAVPEGADGAYAGVVALVHELGLLAYCDALAGAVVYCDYAGFVEHYLVILVDDGIGGAQVYCQLLVQERKCHNSVQ